MQVVPPTPQAVEEVPERQLLPWQQPLQVAGLQVHVPPWQVCPVPQVWQATPPVPQAASEGTVMQLPLLSQQPLQLLQTTPATHCPL